jgi:hypothetical protein
MAALVGFVGIIMLHAALAGAPNDVTTAAALITLVLYVDPWLWVILSAPIRRQWRWLGIALLLLVVLLACVAGVAGGEAAGVLAVQTIFEALLLVSAAGYLIGVPNIVRYYALGITGFRLNFPGQNM